MLFGKMIIEWAQIVGSDLSLKATPVELKFNTSKKKQNNRAILHLAVTSAFAPEIHAQRYIIIERLNTFFGYSAIEDIKLIHKQAENLSHLKHYHKPDQPKLSHQEEHKINQNVSQVKEKELQDALKSLGNAILTRQKQHEALKTTTDKE